MNRYYDKYIVWLRKYFFSIILVLLFGFIGLLNLSQYYYYFVSMIFVFPLYFSLFSRKKFFDFLICLGFFCYLFYGMNRVLFIDAFSIPILTDSPQSLYFYCGFMILLGIISVLFIFINYFNPKMNQNNKIMHIVLILLLIISVMAGVMKYLLPFLCRL